MDTGSFPGIKRPGRGVDHPLPSSAEVNEIVELYLYIPSGPSWSVLGELIFFLHLNFHALLRCDCVFWPLSFRAKVAPLFRM
jgi:hypothetical protein